MLFGLLLAACLPLPTCAAPGATGCATPTPVLVWDQLAVADLSGYALYYRLPGGTFQKLVDLPCSWYDLSEPPDGTIDVRWCRGPELGIPLQRYCPTCAPFTAYDFAVKGINLAGVYSTDYSNIVSVCFSPLCAIRSGPCN